MQRILSVCFVSMTFSGCLEPAQSLAVPTNPFDATPVPIKAARNYQPAALEQAARVDRVGQQLLAANADLGLRPVFRTIGAPQIEVFHRGVAEVTVTEGLVKQCTSDAQLAAILCNELGRMVAEREALASPFTHNPGGRAAPMDTRVGSDNMGTFGSPDMLGLAEMAKFEGGKPRRASQQPATVDPQGVARTCLLKAGYAPAELDNVQPLLLASGENPVFSRGMGSLPAVLGMSP